MGAGAQQQRLRSTAFSSECGQCHEPRDEAEHRLARNQMIHQYREFSVEPIKMKLVLTSFDLPYQRLIAYILLFYNSV